MSEAWQVYRVAADLDEYEARWDRLAEEGHHVHGEADRVAGLAPRAVLDAGCGMGRVAIELARRGIAVVGVDADPEMLARARRRAPDLRWVHADLAELDLGETFDVVVLAGNVLPFVDPTRRPAAVASCARHVAHSGRLVCGAGLAPEWPTVEELDRWCAAAGLELAERHGGWEGQPWVPDGAYAVSVHRWAT